MIIVKKVGETTTQKVISSFIKRAKKYNIVARVRKTAHYLKPISDLMAKRKAIRKAKYLDEQLNSAKLAKKI